MIANASPLILFGKIGRIDILQELYGQIEIVQKVYEEIVIKGGKQKDALFIQEKVKGGGIRIAKLNKEYAERAEKIADRYNIEEGEAATIALALQQRQQSVMIDDHAARVIAMVLGLQPVGSLGVLLQAYKKGLLQKSATESLVEEMLHSKYRVGAEVLLLFWKQMEEIKKEKGI